ncbi:MAG: hypothetical protein GY871_03970 [Actinomycetales bacterium]|nr:hypothetical protein [Actinomycetales bacterium]
MNNPLDQRYHAVLAGLGCGDVEELLEVLNEAFGGPRVRPDSGRCYDCAGAIGGPRSQLHTLDVRTDHYPCDWGVHASRWGTTDTASEHYDGPGPTAGGHFLRCACDAVYAISPQDAQDWSNRK